MEWIAYNEIFGEKDLAALTLYIYRPQSQTYFIYEFAIYSRKSKSVATVIPVAECSRPFKTDTKYGDIIYYENISIFRISIVNIDKNHIHTRVNLMVPRSI